jgi:hypothetical protein
MKIYTRLRRAPAPRFLLSILALSLGGFALAATPASAAPIGFEVFGGVQTNGNNDALAGAGLRLSLASITIIPNGEYYFVDHGNTYTANLDATLTIFPLVYAGAGLGMIVLDPEVGDSRTNSVANVMVGVGLSAAPLKPFAQLKYVFTDGTDPVVFSIGARF